MWNTESVTTLCSPTQSACSCKGGSWLTGTLAYLTQFIGDGVLFPPVHRYSRQCLQSPGLVVLRPGFDLPYLRWMIGEEVLRQLDSRMLRLVLPFLYMLYPRHLVWSVDLSWMLILKVPLAFKFPWLSQYAQSTLVELKSIPNIPLARFDWYGISVYKHFLF
jgi:hypothetical protein